MYAFEAKRGRAGEGSVQRETYMAERKRNNFMMLLYGVCRGSY
jgi:hypothetical protein